MDLLQFSMNLDILTQRSEHTLSNPADFFPQFDSKEIVFDWPDRWVGATCPREVSAFVVQIGAQAMAECEQISFWYSSPGLADGFYLDALRHSKNAPSAFRADVY